MSDDPAALLSYSETNREETAMAKPFRLVTVVAILALTFAAGRLSHAQGQGRSPGADRSGILDAPIVLSGNDVGFRVERQKDNIPVGVLVVRLNGRWVEAAFSTMPRPLAN